MNTVHPTALIGDGVRLGSGNVVGPHVVLVGPLEVGDDCWFGPGVVVGTPPEVRGVRHTAGWDTPVDGPGVRIGSRTVLREMTTVHAGWTTTTVVGDDCFVMNKTYVAHDCEIGDGATLASSVTMGGHVRIGARANVGMGAVVHQRRVVGPGAMVGMGAVVTRDVPPMAKAFGNPARVRGANVVGMGRRGVADDVARRVDDLYACGGTPTGDDVPVLLAEDFRWWREAVRE